MIGGVPKFGHISEFIHWLPVPQRIHYRLSTIVWHCVHVQLYVRLSVCARMYGCIYVSIYVNEFQFFYIRMDMYSATLPRVSKLTCCQCRDASLEADSRICMRY